MKTTLNLNDALVTQAKTLAAQQRTSLTRLIEEGLQLRLKAAASTRRRASVVLPIHHGKGGLVPGVNGLSNKGMLDAADE